MDSLKPIFEKISRYEILANLIPGAILCVFLKNVIGWRFLSDNFLYAMVEVYFAGIVNNRIGSLIVEPLMKHVVKFQSYRAFMQAEKRDSKIGILNADNNMYRSFTSVFLISILAYIYREFWLRIQFLQNNYAILLIIGLLILFVFSYWEQSKILVMRIKEVNNASDNDDAQVETSPEEDKNEILTPEDI